MLIMSRKPAQVIPAAAVLFPRPASGAASYPARAELVFKGFAAWAPLWIPKTGDYLVITINKLHILLDLFSQTMPPSSGTKATGPRGSRSTRCSWRGELPRFFSPFVTVGRPRRPPTLA